MKIFALSTVFFRFIPILQYIFCKYFCKCMLLFAPPPHKQATDQPLCVCRGHKCPLSSVAVWRLLFHSQSVSSYAVSYVQARRSGILLTDSREQSTMYQIASSSINSSLLSADNPPFSPLRISSARSFLTSCIFRIFSSMESLTISL